MTLTLPCQTEALDHADIFARATNDSAERRVDIQSQDLPGAGPRCALSVGRLSGIDSIALGRSAAVLSPRAPSPMPPASSLPSETDHASDPLPFIRMMKRGSIVAPPPRAKAGPAISRSPNEQAGTMFLTIISRLCSFIPLATFV